MGLCGWCWRQRDGCVGESKSTSKNIPAVQKVAMSHGIFITQRVGSADWFGQHQLAHAQDPCGRRLPVLRPVDWRMTPQQQQQRRNIHCSLLCHPFHMSTHICMYYICSTHLSRLHENIHSLSNIKIDRSNIFLLLSPLMEYLVLVSVLLSGRFVLLK
jgi:hypothetical protein